MRMSFLHMLRSQRNDGRTERQRRNARSLGLSILEAGARLLLAFLCLFSVPRTVVAIERSNVLFVLIDDWGWGDLSANGGSGVPTPNMDRIAREGARFTQFYTASPICSASRCGFLTGQFPARWKITSYLQSREGNRECGQADFLSPNAPSFVRTFKEAGYATAHIGKWHLGGGRDVTDAPKFAAYGYDIGLGTYESPEPAAPLGLKSVPWSPKTEPRQVKRHDRTRWMVDETLAFAKQNASRPWLVNVWFDDVHTPYAPSDAQRSAAGEGAGTVDYRAVLSDTDREVGRLLEGLRTMGMDERTIVIVAGDNGPEPSFDRKRTGGMRGMKWSLYEGGIRTPLIVRWPGKIPAKVHDTAIVGAVDFFPTLCALTGVPAPENVKFDGDDLSAVWKGGSHSRKNLLFWEYGRKPANGKGGIRAFPYPTMPGSKSPNIAVRDGDWKLLINADGTECELYNLAIDRDESRNAADANPGVTARLKDAALAWRKSLP